MISPELYILYGFMAFVGVLLLAMLGMIWRQGQAIGELRGDINGLKRDIDALRSDNAALRNDNVALNAKIDRVSDDLNAKIDRVENNVRAEIAALREQYVDLAREVSEMKGMLWSLNQRMDLMMRHRHLPTGEVFLTPEEPPVVD